jgi:hypothetical protein
MMSEGDSRCERTCTGNIYLVLLNDSRNSPKRNFNGVSSMCEADSSEQERLDFGFPCGVSDTAPNDAARGVGQTRLRWMNEGVKELDAERQSGPFLWQNLLITPF